MSEQTLVIIKPDGVKRNLIGEIIRRIEAKGYVISDVKKLTPSKELLAKLQSLGVSNALIVTDAVDENLYLAARNLPHVEVIDTSAVDPVSLIGFDKVIVTVPALKKFEEILG